MTEMAKEGVGFEELYQLTGHPVDEVRMHNPDVYDKDGFPKDDKVYQMIKDKLFLKPHHLNLYNIDYQFIAV